MSNSLAAYRAASRIPWSDYHLTSTFIGVDYNVLPLHLQAHGSESGGNRSAINDPVLEAIYEQAQYAATEEEQMAIVREAEEYCRAQHFNVWVARPQMMCFWQPWLKGYTAKVLCRGVCVVPNGHGAGLTRT